MIELAGFRAPDYILILIAYPLLLVVASVVWLATRVRPKGKRLSLRFQFLGFKFRIENGDTSIKQTNIGEDRD